MTEVKILLEQLQLLRMDMEQLKLLRLDIQNATHSLEIIRKEVNELKPEHDKFVTVRKVAQVLGLSTRRIAQLCETGKIKAVQPGKDKGRWRIPYVELVRLKNEAKANHYNG